MLATEILQYQVTCSARACQRNCVYYIQHVLLRTKYKSTFLRKPFTDNDSQILKLAINFEEGYNQPFQRHNCTAIVHKEKYIQNLVKAI